MRIYKINLLSCRLNKNPLSRRQDPDNDMDRSAPSTHVKFSVKYLKMENYHRLMPAFILTAALILSLIVAGCERKQDEPTKSELLVSTVWENTESCGTASPEPGLYTGIFFPDGRFRTYYKAYETGNSSWRVTGESTLYLNNIESTITELTSNLLTIKGPGSFWGLDIKCFYKYRSLPETNISTIGVSDLSRTSSTLIGYLRTCDEAIVTVEYGTTSSYGSNALHTGNPVLGVTNEVVKITVDGLLPATTYFYRLTAETSEGTIYGTGRKFRTFDAALLTDTDGNEYATTTIGTQVWMTEPLRTTKYNDGSPIPLVTDSLEWVNLESPGYCWYRNDAATYKESYGALYNWYAVSSGKLCPSGWHVPEEQEWVDLINYLGADAGDNLTQGHYDIEHGNAFLEGSNESGFSAVMTATRHDYGFIPSENSNFWSASEEDADMGKIFIANSFTATTTSFLKDSGLPVRCIKD
jgi:uncharacterized protein (TIGR02145 family)